MAAKVSIITPAYQASATLLRAIRSVQEQSFQDWEMIIVDDGSTDDTRLIVETAQSEDARIRYFFQVNQGQAVARNLGAEHAVGEYLAFLDADDEWKAHKLAGQVELLSNNPDIALILGDSVNINLADATEALYSEQHQTTLQSLKVETIAEKLHKFTDPQLRRVLYQMNFVNTSTVMIRKACFERSGRFNPLCRGTEDIDLWVRLAETEHLAYWDDVCAVRYKSADSVSFGSEKWLTELLRFHRMILEHDTYQDLHDIARVQIRLTYRKMVRLHGRQFAPMKALAAFRRSLPDGFDRLTFVYMLASFTGPFLFVAGGQISRMRSRLR